MCNAAIDLAISCDTCTATCYTAACDAHQSVTSVTYAKNSPPSPLPIPGNVVVDFLNTWWTNQHTEMQLSLHPELATQVVGFSQHILCGLGTPLPMLVVSSPEQAELPTRPQHIRYDCLAALNAPYRSVARSLFSDVLSGLILQDDAQQEEHGSSLCFLWQ